MYFLLGPIFLGLAPTLVRGGFHLRFLLSVPLTLGPAVAVAFIPADGSTLGVMSIAWLTAGIGFVAGTLLLNAPFFATDEHKALDQSFGPPLFSIMCLFFGVITAHVVLTQLYSSPLVGLLLPAGSAAIRTLAIVSMSHSIHTFYFEPKQAFLQLSATFSVGRWPSRRPATAHWRRRGHLRLPCCLFRADHRECRVGRDDRRGHTRANFNGLGTELGRLVVDRSGQSHRHPTAR